MRGSLAHPRASGARRSSQRLLAAAITLAVLTMALTAATGQLPIVGRHLPSQGILGATTALLALGLTVYRVQYGMLLLPAVAVAVPFAIGTGTASVVVASLLFACSLIAIWLAKMLASPQQALVRSTVVLPLLAFTATATLSTVYSNVVRPPLVIVWPTFLQSQLGGLSVFVASAGVFLVAMNTMRDGAWLERLVWVYLALGAAAIAGYSLRGGRDLPGFSIGGLFSFWVVLLAVGQVLFNRHLTGWARVGLAIVALAWTYRRFASETSWLSGWLPLAVSLLVLCALRSPRLLAGAAVVYVVIGVLSYDPVYQSQVLGEDSRNNFLRLDLWAQNFEVTKHHLFLGTGVAGYAPYYVTFFPDRAASSHSNYLDIFSQTGLLGSAAFLWFLGAVVSVAIAQRRLHTTGFGAGFSSAVLAALPGLVVAMALGDWVLPFVYNQTISGFRYTVHTWVLLGALAGMREAEAS